MFFYFWSDFAAVDLCTADNYFNLSALMFAVPAQNLLRGFSRWPLIKKNLHLLAEMSAGLNISNAVEFFVNQGPSFKNMSVSKHFHTPEFELSDKLKIAKLLEHANWNARLNYSENTGPYQTINDVRLQYVVFAVCDFLPWGKDI